MSNVLPKVGNPHAFGLNCQHAQNFRSHFGRQHQIHIFAGGALFHHGCFIVRDLGKSLDLSVLKMPTASGNVVGFRCVQHANQTAVLIKLEDAPGTCATVLTRNQVVYVHKAHSRLTGVLLLLDVVLYPDTRRITSCRKFPVKKDVVHVVAHHVGGRREPLPQTVRHGNQNERRHRHHSRQTEG